MSPHTDAGALLPCPFCGGEADHTSLAGPPFKYLVRCLDCAARVQTVGDKGDAFHYWNTRQAASQGTAALCTHPHAKEWMYRDDDTWMICPDCNAKWVLPTLSPPVKTGGDAETNTDVAQHNTDRAPAADEATGDAGSNPVVGALSAAQEASDCGAEIKRLRAQVEYWRLAAERREARKERSGVDAAEARTLDAPEYHAGEHVSLPSADRPCTCHPSEAPVPCQKKYAFSDCMASAHSSTHQNTEAK